MQSDQSESQLASSLFKPSQNSMGSYQRSVVSNTSFVKINDIVTNSNITTKQVTEISDLIYLCTARDN